MIVIEWILWILSSLCGAILVIAALVTKQRDEFFAVGCALAVTSIIFLFVDVSKFHLLWIVLVIALIVPWIFETVETKVEEFKSRKESKESSRRLSLSIQKVIDARIKEQEIKNEFEDYLSSMRYKNLLEGIEDMGDTDSQLVSISRNLKGIEEWLLTMKEASEVQVTEPWKSINDKLRNLEYLDNYLNILMNGAKRNQRKEARNLMTKNHRLKEFVLTFRKYQEAQRNLRITEEAELQFQR